VIDRGAANPSKAAGFGWRYCENPYIRGCDRVRLPHFSSILARTLANEGELADKWLLKKDCSSRAVLSEPPPSLENLQILLKESVVVLA